MEKTLGFPDMNLALALHLPQCHTPWLLLATAGHIKGSRLFLLHHPLPRMLMLPSYNMPDSGL